MIMKRGQDNTSYAIKGLQYLILNRQLLKKKNEKDFTTSETGTIHTVWQQLLFMIQQLIK